MSISDYYRINRKLFAKEKRPSVPYIFLGLGIVLILLSYSAGIGLRRELLREYCDGPLNGVIIAEPEDMSAVNDSVVSRIRGMDGISGATGVYEFPMKISYGSNTVSVSVWAMDRKCIGGMNLSYSSVSEEAMSSQLPLVIQGDTVELLGGTVQAGDRVTVSISGSNVISAEIAAVIITEDSDTQLNSILKGKVFAGLEDAEAIMSILFEHQVWPGQDVEITAANRELMKYRYEMALASDPKKIVEVMKSLEAARYRCMTGFDEYEEQIWKNRPKTLGFLLSGASFLMCAVYLIHQIRRQRLESNRDKINMLRDLGWKESQIRSLAFFDHIVVSLTVVIVSIALGLIIT